MKKKSFVGWTYADEDFEFRNIDAWGGNTSAVALTIMQHKKSLGKFKGIKVKLTIQELPRRRR